MKTSLNPLMYRLSKKWEYMQVLTTEEQVKLKPGHYYVAGMAGGGAGSSGAGGIGGFFENDFTIKTSTTTTIKVGEGGKPVDEGGNGGDYNPFFPKYTFTVMPTPSNATVTLSTNGVVMPTSAVDLGETDFPYDPAENIDGGSDFSSSQYEDLGIFSYQQTGNSIEVDEGTTVTYAISKENYETKTGSQRIYENTVLSGEDATIYLETKKLIVNYTPYDADLSFSTGEVENNTCKVPYGTEVTYTLHRNHYVEQTITTTVTEDNQTETVDLVKENYTFTINPVPADATVVITADGYTQQGNSITVPYATVVSYSVSKEGYTTVSDNNYEVDFTHESTIILDATSEQWTQIYEKTTGGSYSQNLSWGKYKIVLSGAGGCGAAVGIGDTGPTKYANNGYAGEEQTSITEVPYNETYVLSGVVGATGTTSQAWGAANSSSSSISDLASATAGTGGSGYENGNNGISVTGMRKDSDHWMQYDGFAVATGAGGGSSSAVIVENSLSMIAKGGNGGEGRAHNCGDVVGGTGGSGGTTSGTGAAGGAASLVKGTAISGVGSNGYVRIYQSNIYPTPTEVVLTVNTTPVDATVTFSTGTVSVDGHSCTLPYNTAVTYTISKTGYVTSTPVTMTVIANTTINAPALTPATPTLVTSTQTISLSAGTYKYICVGAGGDGRNPGRVAVAGDNTTGPGGPAGGGGGSGYVSVGTFTLSETTNVTFTCGSGIASSISNGNTTLASAACGSTPSSGSTGGNGGCGGGSGGMGQMFLPTTTPTNATPGAGGGTNGYNGGNSNSTGGIGMRNATGALASNGGAIAVKTGNTTCYGESGRGGTGAVNISSTLLSTSGFNSATVDTVIAAMSGGGGGGGSYHYRSRASSAASTVYPTAGGGGGGWFNGTEGTGTSTGTAAGTGGAGAIIYCAI